MSKNVRITGLKEFTNAVVRKGPVVDKELDKEIKLSALRVEKNGKQRAPWDTGWLSNNIYANYIGLLQAEVISPANYSIFVEYGTRYMPAQPFLFPALQTDWPLLQKRINKIMRG